MPIRVRWLGASPPKNSGCLSRPHQAVNVPSASTDLDSHASLLPTLISHKIELETLGGLELLGAGLAGEIVTDLQGIAVQLVNRQQLLPFVRTICASQIQGLRRRRWIQFEGSF